MIGAIVKAMTPPDIQQEITENMAREMAEEIDWEVLRSMLKECGWTEVKLEWPRMTEILAHEIKEWCHANLKGSYHGRGRTWIFSEEKDATLFILKWA
jgi:hypothetical protein